MALLPDRQTVERDLQRRRERLRDLPSWRLARERQRLLDRRRLLEQQAPTARLPRLRQELQQKRLLLQALSPERWLQRGLALVNDASGAAVTGISDVQPGDRLTVQLRDGLLDTRVDAIRPASDASTP